LWFAGLLLVLSVNSSVGDPSQQDTTVPNRFEFSSAEYVVPENITNAVITIYFRPGNRSMSGSCGFRTDDGTAIAGEDYLHVEGSLNFSGGGPRSFSVPIIWDHLDEEDQTVVLWLGGGASHSSAILRITNVPSAPRPPREGAAGGPARKRGPAIVTLNVTERTAFEGGNGAAAVAVRRSHGIENPLRVHYRVTGSAWNGGDYERLEGSVVIPAGSHEATIEVVPLDDELEERTERVAVHLKPAPRHGRKYRLGAAPRRVVEIVDNDRP
jgi:solute carrier family 8 (sodium/calcium exchanger)